MVVPAWIGASHTRRAYVGYAFDSTKGYPGEGPPAKRERGSATDEVTARLGEGPHECAMCMRQLWREEELLMAERRTYGAISGVVCAS